MTYQPTHPPHGYHHHGYGTPWPAPAQPPASPLQALMPRLPDVRARGFWIGAALGAAAVMLLKSHQAATPGRNGLSPTGEG